MAAEIPRLIAEYAKNIATACIDIAIGQPTPKSKIYCALDKIDPLKLAQNPNPDVAVKAAILETYLLPMEKTQQIPEFIYDLNVETDQLIKHLFEIVLKYTLEFISLLKEIAATIESIIRHLLSLIRMILWFTLQFVLQVVYNLIVDVLWTIINIFLIAIWEVYAMLFFTPDSVSVPDMRAPENGGMIMGVLIPCQLIILILYLIYIVLMIVQYVINYILSILLLIILVVTIIVKRALEIPILFERIIQQITGVAGTAPLIPVVIDAQTLGTSVLVAQMINPLPI